MFMAFLGAGFSGGEILIVLVAVLILFGSKNVPHIARTIGKSMEEFRKATRGVTDEIMRADVKDEAPPAKLAQVNPKPPELEENTKEDVPPEPKASENSVQRNDEPV